jgi:hypothetical protein
MIITISPLMITDNNFLVKAEPTKNEIVNTEWGSFETNTIVEVAGNFLGGSDIGDIDDDDNMELVIGGGGKELFISEYETSNEKWRTTSVATDCNGIIAVEIGPVRELGEGNKILFGGFSNELIVLDHQKDEFTKLMKFEDRVWDIKMGDLIPQIDGPEIAVAHSSTNISVLYRDQNNWSRTIVQALGPVTTLYIGEVDNERSGNQLACGSETGELELFYWNGSDFMNEHIFKGDRAIRKMTLGEFNDQRFGNELITVSYSFNSGNATMLYKQNGKWHHEFLYNSTRGLEALSYGDFHPDNPGLEFVFAGYAYTVTMVIEDDGENIACDIWKGSSKLGDLANEIVAVAVGDLYPHNYGDEIFILGSYGSIRMTSYNPANLSIVFDEKNISFPYGSNNKIYGEIHSQGGYEGDVEISSSLLIRDSDGNFTNYTDNEVSVTHPRGKYVYSSFSTLLDLDITIGENVDFTEYMLLLTVRSLSDQKVWSQSAFTFGIIHEKTYRVEIIDFHYEKDSVILSLKNTGSNTISEMNISFFLNNKSVKSFKVIEMENDESVNITFVPELKEGDNFITFIIEDHFIEISPEDRSKYLLVENNSSRSSGNTILFIIAILILFGIMVIVLSRISYSNIKRFIKKKSNKSISHFPSKRR